MNRLTWLMVDSHQNARFYRASHFDSIQTRQVYLQMMHEFWTYQALCQCIRRGYKPIREVEE